MYKWIRRIVILLIIGIVCVLLFGCGKKYHVIYENGRDRFENAKDAYREGQNVKLYYTLIASDTDYYFYVDGKPVNADWNDKKGGYEISFVMPGHDVTVSVSSVNSMLRPIGDKEQITPQKQ